MLESAIGIGSNLHFGSSLGIGGLFQGLEQFHFFIIFDDVVEYLSIRCAQLKKQGRRTEPILTVG